METMKFECDGCKDFFAKSDGLFSTDAAKLALVKAGVSVKFLFFYCNGCLTK